MMCLPLLLVVSIAVVDVVSAACGERGSFYNDAYQGVLFEKQTDQSTGKEFWTPVCVGALLPGKHANYTDSLYISSGCIQSDPSNYVVRYGSNDPIEDMENIRGQYIALFDRLLPEKGSHWNYGLSVAKFMPDALTSNIKTVCLPDSNDNGPEVGTACRLGVITQAGRLTTLPVTILADKECQKMPSYESTELGENIPYDPTFQMCGRESDMKQTFSVFRSNVGPVICDHEGRQTLYGYFLIEPPTLKDGDPFRMTRIKPHMEFVNEMRSSYLNELLASMTQKK
uniref:Peptidase S1 domain-containing protein n=1 Tax=Trichuris muris TaxID=70415 RepID=A0A5S6QIS2_TRIMR